VADPAILVFVHDDVYLCDFFWRGRLREAVERFDIVGLAGNRRRMPRQPSWLFTDVRFNWDEREYLSGAIGHGQGFPCSNISVQVFACNPVSCSRSRMSAAGGIVRRLPKSRSGR